MDNERPDLLALLDSMPRELKEAIAGRDANVCNSPGCPAHVRFDEIMHEDENGTMFVCNNLLVWIPADKLALDREDHTFEMCAGEAKGRQLI